MKLFINQTSPYARKVRIVVKEKKLDAQITLIDVDPWIDPPELLAFSPLSKVPVLVTDENVVLTESDTITRFLDEFASSPPMLPADFTARTEVVSRVALMQGLIDAAFDAVIEKRRPAAAQWDEWSARQLRAVQRGLERVAAPPPPANRFDLGDVSLACLLGYLDYRHPAIKWRDNGSALATWFETVSRRPSMTSTDPGIAV